jgi:divalent metal cation (Fe/Co/Zn/Cd) transporter
MAELDLIPHDDPEQDTPERHKVAQRSTLVSVVVNLLLTTVQVIVGVFAHSQALIADGIHSLSDLIADFVVLVANKHSHKEADDDHPLRASPLRNSGLFGIGCFAVVGRCGHVVGGG